MRVTRINTVEQLAALQHDWDRLSRGAPMRSWAWMAGWWKHLGSRMAERGGGVELFVLCVADESGTLVGIAPWYIERSVLRGRVVRFLGSGSVCSDYLSVLCAAEWESRVAGALADWLLDDRPTVSDWISRRRRNDWDLLDLAGVDAGDAMMESLLAALTARGALIHTREGVSCWRIALPTTWDAYVAMLSKSHRKRVRRLEREMFDTGRAVLHRVQQPQELERGFEVLRRLHTRRWRSRGHNGVFACPDIDAFHREATRRLLRAGQLRMQWLELDGRPVAAEYSLVGDGVVYAYQSGIDPDALASQPGNLATIGMLKSAIADGFHSCDLLRGDEPYKAHWRAERRPSLEIRVRHSRTVDWLRHSVWVLGRNMKDWIRAGRQGAASPAS